jgi:hypothetical protein
MQILCHFVYGAWASSDFKISVVVCGGPRTNSPWRWRDNCMCLYVYLWSHVYVCIFAGMDMHVCLYVSVFVSMYVCLCSCVSIRPCVSLNVFIQVWLRVCVCVRASCDFWNLHFLVPLKVLKPISQILRDDCNDIKKISKHSRNLRDWF